MLLLTYDTTVKQTPNAWCPSVDEWMNSVPNRKVVYPKATLTEEELKGYRVSLISPYGTETEYRKRMNEMWYGALALLAEAFRGLEIK